MSSARRYTFFLFCAVVFGVGSSVQAEVVAPEVDWDAIIERQKESQNVFRIKAEALVKQMTLEEKISLYAMASKPVKRLGIPAHNWWNEAIHGVARNGKATQFPVSIAMASTWDPELILRMADAIGKEARGIYNSRNNPTNRYECLTIWSPTMNLARDPRWEEMKRRMGKIRCLQRRWRPLISGDCRERIRIIIRL